MSERDTSSEAPQERERLREEVVRLRRANAFLTESAIQLVDFPRDGDLHRFIAQKLLEIAPGAAVVVTSFDEASRMMTPRAMLGFEPALDALGELLDAGSDRAALRARGVHLRKLMTGKLVPESLRGMLGGQLSDADIRSLEQLLGVEQTYVMGFLEEGRLLGGLAIMAGAADLEGGRLELIDAFARQASVAIQRRGVEAAQDRLEESLSLSQRMESIGSLAGGVAHDFNNLLQVILGMVGLLRRNAAEPEAVTEGADVIERAALRASSLTAQLLGYARRGKAQDTIFDVHQLLEEVTSIVERTVDKRITLRRQLDAQRAYVRGDPGQLQQVLLNLAVNARDAMPEGGELTFATRVVELEGTDDPPAAELEPGRYLRVTVSDTGSGIPVALRERIFEPFFTTKDPAHGTGMGLAMAYGITRNHGGTIRVTGREGEGATFSVFLPLASFTPARDRHEVARTAPEPPPGTGRILLVDDEPLVLAGNRRVLEIQGYEVVCAENGREALTCYQEQGEGIDLVILDLVMPEMDGAACYRALKQLDPGVRVVLTSGFAVEGLPQRLMDEGALGFLQKPYRGQVLTETVARLMQG